MSLKIEPDSAASSSYFQPAETLEEGKEKKRKKKEVGQAQDLKKLWLSWKEF